MTPSTSAPRNSPGDANSVPDAAHSISSSVSSSGDAGREPDRVLSVGVFMAGAIILALLVILGRVVQLQAFSGQALKDHTPSPTSVRTEIARRGDLLDRRGRVLASSEVGYRLFVDPGLVDDPMTITADLAVLTGADPAALDRLIQPRLDRRYVRLISLLTPAQVDAVRQADLHGVGLEPVLVRHRTYGDVGAALVGTVGADHIGLSGMEYVLNTELTGQSGELRYLRDVRRRAMWVEPAGYRPGNDGRDLRLSIDIEIQRIAEDELTRQVNSHNAGGGRLIVADPRTGEILAMCDVIRSRSGFEDYAVDPARAHDPGLGRIRSVTDPYEPGSTFKPFVWSVATELGVARPEEVINTHDGSWRTPTGRPIHDTYPYSRLAWEMVLVKSSNIGMTTIALRMTPAQMQDAVRRFGFGLPTSVGIPGETSGIVTSPSKWNAYTQASVSFGQEIAVTPLQMVRAFSAFARDGTLPMLRVIASEDDSDWPQPVIEQRAVSEATALQTRLLMRRVMTEGTGRGANQGADYRMFGKSGTAQLADPARGGYFKDRYVISFIAGAPLADPRLVVLCVIEDPDKRIGHLGGAVCGPVVRNVINRTLKYLAVPSDLALDKVAKR